jgi:hypothetical protein
MNNSIIHRHNIRHRAQASKRIQRQKYLQNNQPPHNLKVEGRMPKCFKTPPQLYYTTKPCNTLIKFQITLMVTD